MMKTSRKQFFALAEQHGITVSYTAGCRKHPRTGESVAYEMELDAPEGQAFKSSGCSVDCSLHGAPGETSPNWPALTASLRAIIAEGFEPDTEEA